MINIAIICCKIGELVEQETFNATWVVSKKVTITMRRNLIYHSYFLL